MHGNVHLFDRLPLVAEPALDADRAGTPPVRAVPLVGVICNTRSHRNGSIMPSWTGRAQLMVETPKKRRELLDILARFADKRIDYLVIAGGDGTVRDVLTCGAGVFGKSWPELILLPSGKTNALAADLGLSAGWTLDDALDAARQGRRVSRHPLVVAQRDTPDAQVHGFVFGAGAYTAAIGLGQSAHRRGAFDAMAVLMTTLGTLVRAFFGGPDHVWRRGTGMVLRDGNGVPLPHSGKGPEDERYIVFASTLNTFPAGLKPFRGVPGRLHLGAIDRADAGALLRVPLIASGHAGKGQSRNGTHIFGLDNYEIDLADSFILDGEAFPAGQYRLSLGPKLRFIVP